MPPPFGIFQVPRRRLIEVDEFGATFERCNRTGGWAVKVLRVQKDGHYHHGTKITIIFAIEPGIRPCLHMLEGALIVLDAGSDVYVPLAPPPTYSVIFGY